MSTRYMNCQKEDELILKEVQEIIKRHYEDSIDSIQGKSIWFTLKRKDESIGFYDKDKLIASQVIKNSEILNVKRLVFIDNTTYYSLQFIE